MSNLIPKTIGFLVNTISHFSSKSAAKLSLTLFTRPRKGKVSSLQSNFLELSIRETLEYENIPIMTYRWEGRRKTILLAHGWESNSFRWKELIENLRDEAYNVIAMDAPAHGNSGGKIFNAILYSEFINVVIKKFNPDVIIGHSVGGMASVFAQANYNKFSLEKLVLLGAPSQFEGVLQRYVSMMGYNKKVHSKIKAVIYEQFGNWPEYYSTARFSESINAEGLIIHDENDLVIPYNDAQLIASSYVNSRLISTTGYGHGLKNQTIYNSILEFINS